jgi:hypothetical protein
LFGGELQIRFGVDELLEVTGDAVDPFQTFGDCLRRDDDLRRNLVAVNPTEAIEPRSASSTDRVGDPVKGEHGGVGETLGQNEDTRVEAAMAAATMACAELAKVKPFWR